MTELPASEPFRLPRLSRIKTRSRDAAPRWSQLLAQLGFVVLFILAIGGPWMTDQDDDRLRQIREIGYVVVLALAVVSIRPWRHPERLLVVPWPLLLALAWCAVSLAWSVQPGVGLRRLALTAIVLWSLFALVREIGVERSVTILRILLAALLVINFVVVLVFPAVGIHGPQEHDLAGDWRGIMGQKNFAGFISAVTVLLFAFGGGRMPLPLRVGVAFAAAIFLALSDSATSMGVGVAALLVGGLFAWLAVRYGQRPLAAPGWAWLPLGLLALVVVSMALNPAYYLQLTSDPQGFTGRHQIWTALIKAYADRPLLGVGYGSLWDLGPASPIAHYATGWVSEVSQGHNGFLDLLVQIGGPGTLLVLFATLVWPLQRLLRGGDQPARVLGAAILIFCLGHNFTESTLFDRDALGQMFLMFAMALLWNATAMAVHASVRPDVPPPARKSSGERPSRRHRRSA